MYEKLSKSVDNYAKKMEVEKTDNKYIKLFSTFMSNWEDYLEIEAQPESKTVSKANIMACLSAGIVKLNDLPMYPDLKLSEADSEFIRNNGGFTSLGRMSEFEFSRLFSG